MRRPRAITSTGAVVDSPSPDDLAALLAEVRRAGRGAFLIVERGPRQTYLQAVVGAGGFVVEFHDGVRCAGTDPADDLALLALFTAWTRGGVPVA